MWNIETSLSGENLDLYYKIQETIRMTKHKVNALRERSSPEDIFPILRSNSSVGANVTSSSQESNPEILVLSTGEIGIKARDREYAYQARKQAISGLGGLASQRSYFMDDEVYPGPVNDSRLSKITQTSSQEKFLRAKGSLASADHPKPERTTNEEINMRLYDKLSPEEQKMIYERICERYGQESGRRYLMVRSMNSTDGDSKIEAWITSKCSPPTREKKFSKDEVSCPEYSSQHKFISPEERDSVQKKMETLVGRNHFLHWHRKWKNNLKQKPLRTQGRFHVSAVGDQFSFSVDDSNSDITPCQCGTYGCDCGQHKVQCGNQKIKKDCYLMTDETNNFLITCRENLREKKMQDRRESVMQQNAKKVAKRETKESVYLQSCHNKVKSELETCLIKVMPPYQTQEVTEKGEIHVEQLANVIAERKMIPEHEWRTWRHLEAKMAINENSDELDSIDSDILSSDSSEDDTSECNLQVSSLAHPSRIPYFKETYELAGVFFDKLTAKMDKLISKNHNRRQTKIMHPMSYTLIENINLLRSSSKLFNQITKCHKTQNDFSKKLTPFSERRRRKQARANIMKNELLRKQRFRNHIEGIQLGKTYPKPKRSFLFTKSENFRGFSPRRRKLLLEHGDIKFSKYNLVGGNLAGCAVGQKALHRDYRMIRRMFDDDDVNRKKESLLDPGMMARRKEFLGMLKHAKQPEEEYEQEKDKSTFSFAASQRRPKKDEQKTQTAMPCSKSFISRYPENASETLTPMIRCLWCEAETLAEHTSTKTDSIADGVTNPQSLTWQSNAPTECLGSQRSGQKSLGFVQGSRLESHHIPSSVRRNVELNHTFKTQQTSIPQSACPKHIPRKTTQAKPASACKTIPLLQSSRPKIKHLHQNSRCLSSKTVS